MTWSAALRGGVRYLFPNLHMTTANLRLVPWNDHDG